MVKLVLESRGGKRYEKNILITLLMPAARTNYPSILEQVVLKGDIVVGLGSYDQYEDIQTIIGTGETVVLTVPVIVSNDISKTN